MPEVRTILIAAPELIPALRDRLGGSDDEVLTFADSEPVVALKAIVSVRPGLVALERLFAASPRGAALIARIKADPTLDSAQIRILSHDSKYSRVSPRLRPSGGAAARPASVHFDAGTRRAPRYRLREGLELIVQERPARLLDLSELGAQIAAKAPLKPRQEIHLQLDPAGHNLALDARVAWVQLELRRGGSIYRAGVEFDSPDREAIARFCEENRV